MVVIKADGYQTMTIDELPVTKKVEEISWTLDEIEKSGYDHFMKKEIFEQPNAMRNTMRNNCVKSTRLSGSWHWHARLPWSSS